MNDQYSKLLVECGDDWKTFFEAILSHTNLKTDTVLKDQIEQADPAQMKKLFEAIKADSSIRDHWVCRFSIAGHFEGREKKRRMDPVGKKAATVKDVLDKVLDEIELKPAPKLPSLVGGELREKLGLFANRILPCVVSGEGGVFAVVGRRKHGKTTILRHLTSFLDSHDISTSVLDTSTPVKSILGEGTRNVFIIDDIDHEAEMGLDLRSVMRHVSKTWSKTVIVSCVDASVLSRLSGRLEPRILSIPDYASDEIVSIISSIELGVCKTPTDTQKPGRLENIVGSYIYNLLAVGGVQNVLEAAQETINYLLLMEDGYSTDSGDYLKIAFSAESMERAVEVCAGKRYSAGAVELGESIREDLLDYIIGQDQVIDMVVPILVNAKLGLSDPSRPAAALLAVGPTGTGKTELGRAIADIFYCGNLYKEDMNLFYDRHMIARLIGAPPGYTGYSDLPGILRFVKEKTSGVIILDEIEKAHDSVRDSIMEMLDTGFMRDAKGDLVDFRNFFIIMTSNSGYDRTESSSKTIGFSKKKPDSSPDLTKDFTKSFLARTTIVTFRDFSDTDVRMIAEKLFGEMYNRLLASRVLTSRDLVSGDCRSEMIDMIVSTFDKESGARSMRVYVDTTLKHRIIDMEKEARNNVKDIEA